MQDFVGAKGVIPAEQLAKLSERSNWQGLVQLAGHFGAIVVVGWALSLTGSSWLSLPLFMLLGVLLNYLYAPTHECDHFTAFKSRWLNIWSQGCADLLFLILAIITVGLILHTIETPRTGKKTQNLIAQRFAQLGSSCCL